MNTCMRCGADNRDANRKWCAMCREYQRDANRKHRNKTLGPAPEMACAWCGERIPDGRARRNSRWCSDKCRYTQRDHESPPRPKMTMCAGRCGEMIHLGRGSLPPGEAMCRKCRNARKAELALVAPCFIDGCDMPTHKSCMCELHYTQWRTAGRQRRDALRGGAQWILQPDRIAIYERDQWVCQLCHEPTDRNAGKNDDLAPSLDHIVPRSLGGTHDEDNLRTTHRICNIKRGAGVVRAA